MIGLERDPRLAELVRRRFGEEEIVPPGISLQLDRPEWSHLAGEIRGWSSQIVAAVAAQFSRISIRNPAGSNSLWIGTQIVAGGVGASQIVEVRLDPTVTVATPVRLNAADSRRPGWAAVAGAGPITIQADTNASVASASGPVWRQQFDVANQTRELGIGPYILSPGHELMVTVNVVNVGLVVNFYGYTRFATAEELSSET